MPFVTNQTVRIHYEVEGNGPPIVLQHGFFGTLEDWYDYGYVSALKENYTLIRIDARGHGESDILYEPDDYTLQLYGSDIIAVLDTLNIDKCHYIGFSMGGRIGYGLAQYWLERLHSLIILDSHPYSFDDDDDDGAEKFFEACRTIKTWGAEMPKASPEHRARLVKNDEQALVAAARLQRVIDSETLAKIDVPCLMVAASDSDSFEYAKRSSEAIKNAEFVSMDGFDHVDMLFRGDEVLPHIVDFLARVK